jgi:hypothetical protein
MGGVGKKQKKYKTKLGGEKYFCKVTYWAPLELAIIRADVQQLERPMSLITSFTLFHSPPHLPPPPFHY